MDNPVQGFKADSALSDVFMAVFGRAAGIFAVIDMKDGNLVFADNLVKMADNTVEIMDNIISGIVRMAGIETDTQLVIVHDAVINSCLLYTSDAADD